MPTRLSLSSFSLPLVATVIFIATSFVGGTSHLPALILRILAIVICLALWPKGPVFIRYRDFVAPGFAVLLVMSSLPFSPNLGPALQAGISVILVTTLYLVFRLGSAPRISQGLLVFGLVGVLHALWVIGEWIFYAKLRSHGGFFNPNDLAAFLAPLFVWALVQGLKNIGPRTPDSNQQIFPEKFWTSCLSRHPRLYTGVWFVVAGILALGVLATGSRSGQAACLLGAVVLIVARPKLSLVGLGALLVIAVLAMPNLRARWLGERDGFAYARVQIWQAALKVFAENPFGVGLGGAEAALRRQGVPLEGWVRFPRRANDAHSEVLNALVELGFLGGLAVVLPPATLLISLLKRRRSRAALGKTDRHIIYNLAILAAFMFPALVSASLHVRIIAYFSAIWAAGVVRTDKSEGFGKLVVLPRALGFLILGAAFLAALPGSMANFSNERAVNLRDQNQLESALNWAELGKALTPFSPGSAMLAASLRFALDEPAEKVLQELFTIAAKFPNAVEPAKRAAEILENLAKKEPGSTMLWALAIEARREELNRDPNNASVLVAIARLEWLILDREAARATLHRAQALEPHCARALCYLALMAAEDGDNEKAMSFAQAAWQAHAQAKWHHGPSREILSLDNECIIILRRLFTNYQR